MARVRSKACADGAKAPSKLPNPSNVSPSSMMRRGPSRSASVPATAPMAMPASWMMDSRKPPCTSVSPSPSANTGMAGGSLPTCKALTTPTKTMSTAIERVDSAG